MSTAPPPTPYFVFRACGAWSCVLPIENRCGVDNNEVSVCCLVVGWLVRLVWLFGWLVVGWLVWLVWLFGWLVVGRLFVGWLFVDWLLFVYFCWLIVCLLVGWLVGRLIGWLISSSVGRLVSWSIRWPGCWLVGLLPTSGRSRLSRSSAVDPVSAVMMCCAGSVLRM